MPKTIPDLSNKIIKEAGRLFAELGYDGVDMKQVAAAAGCSVGNLYNYYPSKPALFKELAGQWRSRIVERCIQSLDQDGPPQERVLACLNVITRNISNVRGFWLEFRQSPDRHEIKDESRCRTRENPWGMNQEELAFISRLNRLMMPDEPDDGTYRWAYSLLTAATQMSLRFGAEEEINQKFLRDLVYRLMPATRRETSGD